jgi:hypothetical protein
MRIGEALQRNVWRPCPVVVLQVADPCVAEVQARCRTVAGVPVQPVLGSIAEAPTRPEIVPNGSPSKIHLPHMAVEKIQVPVDHQCLEVDRPTER